VALKDFDDINPRTRDKNWKEDIPLAQMPKRDEWYTFRVCGGVFSYAQHWIEFVNKQGETKRYPVDCSNWDPEEEATTKKGGCPCCELGLRPSVRYMMNAIDRDAQDGRGDPIRALDLAPTVMRQLVDLKKLNMVKGNPRSIAHAKFGCDIHLMKQNSKKRGGVEWQVQKGDRCALSSEELELECIDFGDYWLEPDTHKIREDLKRHGYYSEEGDDDDDGDEEVVPKKKKSKTKTKTKKSPKRRKPPVDEDLDDEDEDDDFDAPPPRKKPSRKRAKTPPPEDLDDDEDEDDEDEDDAPPPRRRRQTKAAKKIRRAPPIEDDDDDDDDFDDDFDDED
jgi:hypothetical protein